MQSLRYLGKNHGFLVEPRLTNFGRTLIKETSLPVLSPFSELDR